MLCSRKSIILIDTSGRLFIYDHTIKKVRLVYFTFLFVFLH